eukprot:762661-Rhodomonas_salina.1
MPTISASHLSSPGLAVPDIHRGKWLVGRQLWVDREVNLASAAQASSNPCSDSFSIAIAVKIFDCQSPAVHLICQSQAKVVNQLSHKAGNSNSLPEADSSASSVYILQI